MTKSIDVVRPTMPTIPPASWLMRERSVAPEATRRGGDTEGSTR